MAPFVRAYCSNCRVDVAAPYSDVRVLHFPKDVEWVGFRCPDCGTDSMVPLPGYASQAVHAAGFPVLVMPDAKPSKLPALTEDDLIAFGLALEGAKEVVLD